MKGVLRARCTDNLSNQWEIHSTRKLQLVHSDVLDQCLLSQLVVGNNLLHLLMITHNAVQSVSSDINQKCWRNLKSFKYLPQLINGQRVGTP